MVNNVFLVFAFIFALLLGSVFVVFIVKLVARSYFDEKLRHYRQMLGVGEPVSRESKNQFEKENIQ